MPKECRWLLAAVSLLWVLSLLAAACVPVPAAVQTTSAPGAPSPTPAKIKTGGILQAPWGSEQIGLDPPIERIRNYVPLAYAGLVKTTPELEVLPDLGESWELSKDGLTWTFKLVKGAKFHNLPPTNGREVKAEDVVYSLKRVGDPDPKFQWGYLTKDIVKYETPDEYTVKLATASPVAAILSYLANVAAAMVPKEAVEKYGDLRKFFIGAGPFSIGDNYKPGVVWSFRKHEGYHGKGKPYLDGVDQLIMLEAAPRVAAFRTGKVDTLRTYNTWVEVEAILKTNPDAKWFLGYGSALGLIINTQKPPFNNVKVRRAIHLALDRQAISATGELGKAKIVGFVPFHFKDFAIPEAEILKMPGFRQPKDADLAEAKKLMADAGVTTPVKTILPVFSAYKSHIPPLVEQLAKLGIEAEARVVLTPEFTRIQVERNFDLLYSALAHMDTDVDYHIYAPYGTGASQNWAKYSNPKLDVVLDKERAAIDRKERAKYVREAENILFEDLPTLPTTTTANFSVVQPWVKNYDRIINWPAWYYVRFMDEVWLDK